MSQTLTYTIISILILVAALGWGTLLYFLRKLKKETQPILSELEYAGHKLKLINPTNLSKARQLAIARGEYEREWGISKVDLLSFLHHISEQSENSKVTYHTSENLISLVQEDFQYMPFLRAACYMVLLDDENPKKIDHKANEKKISLCLESDDVMSFFLCNILAFTKNTDSSQIITEVSELLAEKWRLDTEKVIYSQLSKINATNSPT